MTFGAIITLGVLCFVFLALQRQWGSTDLLFLGGVGALTLLGVISSEQALMGFSNPAVVMVGAMLVVGAGMRSTGALDWVGRVLLGKVESENAVLRRLAVVVTFLSALINNTTIVAMFAPVIVHWCRRHNISPSKLLIPLSYLAILGGVCTLIGTSTNVTVNGLLVAEGNKKEKNEFKYTEAQRHELRAMTFLEIGYVGLPCAIVGSLYLLFVGRKMLPNRVEALEQLGDERREYLVEMLVQPDCRLIGKTVQEAGLRHLPGLFLIEIDRTDNLIAPVSPDDTILSGDRLVFTGIVNTIVDLEKIPGLVPAADFTYEVSPQQRSRRHLTEAVISHTSPLIGKTVREANFRQLYNAAVVAVHRQGKRVSRKIGDIRLRPGDTLLLQTRQHFDTTFRNHPDFFLVSGVEGSEAGRTDRAWIAFALLGLLVLLLLFGSLIPLFGTPTPGSSWATLAKTLQSAAFPAIASLIVAVLMVALRCVQISQAHSAVELEIVLTIAAGVGMAQALDGSGLAQLIAESLNSMAGGYGPYALLAAIYLITMLVTELLSNNAAAALMFPLGVALAVQGGHSPRPFVMAVCLAASVAFMTPIGYQTNLMVMGPGGYRPSDFFRVGFPLNLLMFLTSLLLIPLVWPF